MFSGTGTAFEWDQAKPDSCALVVSPDGLAGELLIRTEGGQGVVGIVQTSPSCNEKETATSWTYAAAAGRLGTGPISTVKAHRRGAAGGLLVSADEMYVLSGHRYRVNE